MRGPAGRRGSRCLGRGGESPSAGGRPRRPDGEVMNLGRYVVRKLIEIVPALVLVSLLVFILVAPHARRPDHPHAGSVCVSGPHRRDRARSTTSIGHCRTSTSAGPGGSFAVTWTVDPDTRARRKMIARSTPRHLLVAVWATIFSCVVVHPGRGRRGRPCGRPLDTMTVGATALLSVDPGFRDGDRSRAGGRRGAPGLSDGGLCALFTDPLGSSVTS